MEERGGPPNANSWTRPWIHMHQLTLMLSWSQAVLSEAKPLVRRRAAGGGGICGPAFLYTPPRPDTGGACTFGGARNLDGQVGGGARKFVGGRPAPRRFDATMMSRARLTDRSRYRSLGGRVCHTASRRAQSRISRPRGTRGAGRFSSLFCPARILAGDRAPTERGVLTGDGARSPRTCSPTRAAAVVVSLARSSSNSKATTGAAASATPASASTAKSGISYDQNSFDGDLTRNNTTNS